MKTLLLTALTGLLLLTACGDSAEPIGGNSTDYDEYIEDDITKADGAVRSPIKSERVVDPAMLAAIEFEQEEQDFGTITEGTQVERLYRFKNVGPKPLVIETVNVTCGCTVPEYPRDPIPPGGTGEITLKFNSSNKKGDIRRTLNVVANTWPTTTPFKIKGFVAPAS